MKPSPRFAFPEIDWHIGLWMRVTQSFLSFLSCITALLGCHANLDARGEQRLRLRHGDALLIRMVQQQLKSPQEDKCGFLQMKGKILRAGFEKRTEFTIICTASC